MLVLLKNGGGIHAFANAGSQYLVTVGILASSILSGIVVDLFKAFITKRGHSRILSVVKKNQDHGEVGKV